MSGPGEAVEFAPFHSINDSQPQSVPHDAIHHHGLALDHPDREALSRWAQVQREPLLAANRLRADDPELLLFRVVLLDDDVAWDSQQALPGTWALEISDRGAFDA